MAVKLRLKRMGRKNRPFYRIAVMDERRPSGGKTLELIGYYDPLVRDSAKGTVVSKERAEFWLGRGAQPSETVLSILRKHDVAIPIRRKRRKSRKRRRGQKDEKES